MKIPAALDQTAGHDEVHLEIRVSQNLDVASSRNNYELLKSTRWRGGEERSPALEAACLVEKSVLVAGGADS